MSVFACFIKDESGATAIEYNLIAALLSVAIIGSFRHWVVRSTQPTRQSWLPSPARNHALHGFQWSGRARWPLRLVFVNRGGKNWFRKTLFFGWLSDVLHAILFL
jgi:Flp pilus assembly pilin Flp